MPSDQIIQILLGVVGALGAALGTIATYEIKTLREKLSDFERRSSEFAKAQQMQRLEDSLNDKEKRLREEIKEVARDLRSDFRESRLGQAHRLAAPQTTAAALPAAIPSSAVEVFPRYPNEMSKEIREKFRYSG